MKQLSPEELRIKNYGRKMNIGDIVWRPAVAHAESGLLPLDVDVKEEAPTNIGTALVMGYVIYAVTGDIERLGVLPIRSDFHRKDKALRVCQSWIPNDKKANEYVGMKIYMGSQPPAGWTHVVIERIRRIPIPGSAQIYLKYEGRWVADPSAFTQRYCEATLRDMERSPNTRALKNDPKFRLKLAGIFELSRVKTNLGIDSLTLETSADCVESAPTAPETQIPESSPETC